MTATAQEFEFTDGRRESLGIVGPSLWGDVLSGGSHAYRLMPRGADTAEFRALAREWMERPQRPHLASIVSVEHARKSGSEEWHLCLRYHIGDGVPLRAALAASSPAERIDALCTVFRSIHAWQAQPHLLLTPTAADVWLVYGSPRLLVTPCWGLPDVEQLLDSAERALCLAPEILQGRLSADWEYQQGIYSIGMLLFLAFYEVPDATAEQRLERIASGRLLADPGLRCRLHGWQEKLSRTKALLVDVCNAVHPDPKVRGTTDLVKVAEAISTWAPDLDPSHAVQTLRSGGYIREALQLVQELVFSDSRPEYLVLAAQIHAEDLGQPLEALALYEAAIEAEPGLVRAYEEQLEVLLTLSAMGLLPSLLRRDGKSVSEMDAIVRRNYDKVPVGARPKFDVGMIRFLLGQRKHQQAADFVYPRLFDERAEYLWFRFDLTLAYAEATIELGNDDETAAQLDAIASDIERIKQRKTMSAEELAGYSSTLQGLRDELHRRQARSSRRGVS